jgi:hypothetical protein
MRLTASLAFSGRRYERRLNLRFLPLHSLVAIAAFLAARASEPCATSSNQIDDEGSDKPAPLAPEAVRLRRVRRRIDFFP